MAVRTTAGGIAIYARYSSELQNPRSIDDQVAELRKSIARDGGNPDDAIVFSDEKTSGSVWERTGLQALRRAIEAGQVRTLYVEHPDRLSRDVGDQDRLRKELLYRDVRLVCQNGMVLDGSASASLTFGVSAAVSENYLRDLADKTRRGLRGNAREGKATGGRAYGYRTGNESRIEVVEQEAGIVRDIFRMYAEGMGYARIAAELNRRGIEPPRGSRRRAGGGWMGSAIREMLRNPKYIGEWRFGVREWRKNPATRKRTARLGDAAKVETSMRPELAIIDRATWDIVQAKLTEHAQNWKRATSARAVPHRRTDYLLSGLLRCGVCGALMEIWSGSSARYYRCSANRKRGTCENRLAVKEHVARDRILAAVSDALWNPGALERIRQHVAQRLGEVTQRLSAELSERRARLHRHEERVRAIITRQLDGDGSPILAEMRRDFEAQALQERAALAELEALSRTPLRLPSPQELAEDRVLALDALYEAEGEAVEPARERLRALLKGGDIRLMPDGGTYTARADLLPLEILIRTPETETPLRGTERRSPHRVARGRNAGCRTLRKCRLERDYGRTGVARNRGDIRRRIRSSTRLRAAQASVPAFSTPVAASRSTISVGVRPSA